MSQLFCTYPNVVPLGPNGLTQTLSHWALMDSPKRCPTEPQWTHVNVVPLSPNGLTQTLSHWAPMDSPKRCPTGPQLTHQNVFPLGPNGLTQTLSHWAPMDSPKRCPTGPQCPTPRSVRSRHNQSRRQCWRLGTEKQKNILYFVLYIFYHEHT